MERPGKGKGREAKKVTAWPGLACVDELIVDSIPCSTASIKTVGEPRLIMPQEARNIYDVVSVSSSYDHRPSLLTTQSHQCSGNHVMQQCSSSYSEPMQCSEYLEERESERGTYAVHKRLTSIQFLNSQVQDCSYGIDAEHMYRSLRAGARSLLISISISAASTWCCWLYYILLLGHWSQRNDSLTQL